MISQKVLNIIKESEGLYLHPYKCPAGVWTIGYGLTFYPDGKPVTRNDPPITKDQAEQFLLTAVGKFSSQVRKLVTSKININQLSALTSFAYNVGIGALKGSTLLRKVNANPNDPTITDEFRKWNKASGKVLPGLTKRREKEAEAYFS